MDEESSDIVIDLPEEVLVLLKKAAKASGFAVEEYILYAALIDAAALFDQLSAEATTLYKEMEKANED